jgi:uncharacterized damage-inducible protein DinB
VNEISALGVRERLKARMAIVREDLDEVLGRLTDADLPWAPTAGMRTVGGQLAEIAGTERQVLTWMRDGKHLSFEEAENFGDSSSTLDGMKRVLNETRRETLAYLDSLSDADLETPAPFPERWFESLRQPMMQRSEAFRSIAEHEWYHVGQLVSYLWSRGDDPYKW